MGKKMQRERKGENLHNGTNRNCQRPSLETPQTRPKCPIHCHPRGSRVGSKNSDCFFFFFCKSREILLFLGFLGFGSFGTSFYGRRENEEEAEGRDF